MVNLGQHMAFNHNDEVRSEDHKVLTTMVYSAHTMLKPTPSITGRSKHLTTKRTNRSKQTKYNYLSFGE
jgi:hypothetical protein